MISPDVERDLDRSIEGLENKLRHWPGSLSGGRIVGAVGTLVTADLAGGEIGEICDLRDPDRGLLGRGEIVAIEAGRAILAPYAGIAGLSERTLVVRRREGATVDVGRHLLGAVLDGTGNVLRPGIDPYTDDPRRQRCPTTAAAPAPLTRRPIETPFPIGLRSVDGLLTCGEGQRVGIFGAAGLGKSTLIGSIIEHAAYDVGVVALVGERGREAAEFVQERLESSAASRLVLVVSTSDRPALERIQAALVATTIAEHFRDAGLRVLLVVDSVTRYARALREVGLAAGEPPVRRGFPPSVFAQLPQLFERAGNSRHGTMTAFYTVLAEGDLESDPVAEETRSLLDGHIVLSRRLMSMDWLPAIDVLESRSRLMDKVTSPAHRRAASRLRDLIDRHQRLELLLKLGEYRSGRDPDDDAAVARWPEIRSFLVQAGRDEAEFGGTIARMESLAR